MTIQSDVCFFKGNAFDLGSCTRVLTKPLIGPDLRAGGGKPPKKPPQPNSGDDNHHEGAKPHASLGAYYLTWKGKALLAFAAASMALGINQAHDMAQGLAEFKENVITAAKHCPTNASFSYCKP